ncbi:MAG: type IV pilin protein [Candidatus Omnitrophota bacterium]
MNDLTKNPWGFTLVEIMITVVIIGVLAGLALPRYLDSVERQYAEKAARNMQSIYLAGKEYEAGGGTSCGPSNNGCDAKPFPPGFLNSLDEINQKLHLNLPRDDKFSYSAGNDIIRAGRAKKVAGHTMYSLYIRFEDWLNADEGEILCFSDQNLCPEGDFIIIDAVQ